MFKHQFVGRLGLFVSVLVFANACAGGDIGDVPGGARLGPEASDPSQAGDPEIGNEASPLVCPGASPDISAQNGWQGSEASLPADGALRFELKARPTAANLDGLVAVGAEDIDEFAKAAIAVRFADNGLVDVRDGAFYSSDLAYPYDPGLWYSIAISADIDAKTYDVEIGPCGEARKTLINDASFRDDANVSGQLSAWAVWSSQAAALEVSTPAWMDSAGCAPATCLALGHLCGTPQDGCGGTLSCGVCGDGEMCSSGTCIDAPANASPPPPPSCTPATCQSLGRECGQWGDGCGGILSCGSCNGGQLCSAGVCIDVPPNAPPPPACTPATCQSLGNECGQWGDGCGGILSCGSCNGGELCSAGFCIDVPPSAPPPPACTPASCQSLGTECGLQSDGCGGTLSCGSCGGGETCSSGACIDASPPPPSPAPPPTGTPYGHVVPSDVGKTIGVGVVAPVPTEVYTGPLTITADGTTIENVIINAGNQGLTIRGASNVTIRNVILNSNGDREFFIGHWDDPDMDNLLVEYSQINSTASGKCFNINNATNVVIRRNETIGCQDFYFMNRSIDGFISENNYHHSLVGSPDAHADGYHIGDFGVTTGTVTIRGNYYEADNSTIGKTDILWSTGNDRNQTVLLMENNYFTPWGSFTLRRIDGTGTATIRNNVYAQAFKTAFPSDPNISGALLVQDDTAPLMVYECNRYEDGSFIEQEWLKYGTIPVTHVTTGCPSYP